MKEKLISRLVMGALVGLTATGAYAGQIQSSSVSVAREVIISDAQAVTSPRIAYRFAGDVDARSQNQTFQVQFTLTNGALWTSAGTVPAAPYATPTLLVTDGVTAAAAVLGTDYTVGTLSLSADKTTLFATITVLQSGVGLIKQPLISISSDTVTAANNPTIKNLKTVVGTVAACDTVVKTLPVSFKHYVALTNPATLAGDANATPDEHNRGGATNTTTLISFPTNIKVTVTPSIGNAKIDVSAAGQSLAFAGAALGAAPTAPVADSVVAVNPTKVVNLGAVSLSQQASGYDANLADQYLLGDAAGDADAVAGVFGTATAAYGVGSTTPDGGTLEVKQVDVVVSASQGFVVGGNLFLNTAADCAAGTAIGGTASVAITAVNATTPVTLTIPTASVNAAFGATGTNPVYVCYGAGGTVAAPAVAATPIPTSTFAIDAATLVKAPDTGANTFSEQNNSCNGPLFALSGSVKIDVRNFADASRTDGWMSIVRLINNSESRTSNVYGQYIHADGKYGKWGKLATLAPRAVLNMTSAQIDAKLTSAPIHATAANNAAAGDTPHNATTQDAPRLRITTSDGNTLRVQNYLFNPASQNFIEASSSQGVDFTGAADRAPVNEGQYQDQDAQVGLNGGN